MFLLVGRPVALIITNPAIRLASFPLSIAWQVLFSSERRANIFGCVFVVALVSWLLPAPVQPFVSSKLHVNRTVVVSFQQYFSFQHPSSCLLLLLLFFQMFHSLHLYRQHQTVYLPMEIKECLLFHQTWLQLWSKRAPSIQLWDHQLLCLRPAHPPARMLTQFKVSCEKDLSHSVD